MRIPVIPDWCDGLPDNVMLRSTEIFEFFGYAKSMGSTHGIAKGYIPEPFGSWVNKRGSRFRYVWTLGQLRQLRIDMMEEAE